MKHNRLTALALTLCLLCAACGGEQKKPEGDYLLYFTTDAQSGYGSAVDTEAYGGVSGPDAGDLIAALFAGPTRDGLVSPFPRGVALQQWEWDEEQPGNIKLWLSEQYSGLADISLTLADYCIVLTLAQLDGVASVEIISEGHTANYRSHQLLLPEEAVLTDGKTG